MPSLGNDLASIREQHNLSIEDVHHSIKIPVAILESIEDDSIFTTLDENVTYIRSYIRSYARALKIEDRQIIRALDQAQKNQYSGFLTDRNDEDAISSDQAAGADSESASNTGDTEEKTHQAEPSTGKIDDKKHPPSEQTVPHTTPPPTVNTVDWVDMGQRFIPLESKSRVWMIVAFLILVLAATATFVIYKNYYSESTPTDQHSSPSRISAQRPETPAADSLKLNLQAPANEVENEVRVSATTLKALPDTLTMVIYAAYDVLEPVRVYSDVMDSLNPYWIEHGEAYKFDFVNTIRIRGQYSRMVLLLNGHVIKDFRQRFYNPETRMIEFDRSTFENDPQWLQPPPDSLEIDAPKPTVIKERPIYN